MYEDTDDGLTTGTESDIREESDKDEYSAFIFTLSDVVVSQDVQQGVDPVDEKVVHISEEYAAEMKHLFQSYPDVIAFSFDDVRPSKGRATHRLDLSRMNRYS